MSNNFRKNVGIIIINKDKKVLIAKRSFKNIKNNNDFWQFPQGGIKSNEQPIDALYREIKEELNLDKNQFEILGQTSNWLYYKKEITKNNKTYDGQKQKWFLVKLINNNIEQIKIHLKKPNQELEQIKFVSYWFPINCVIDFKKPIYNKVLKSFIDIYNIV
tara:strand:- start:320 stop:802 length:483 start_codon:yes stop_codon:yes gene_type:complete